MTDLMNRRRFLQALALSALTAGAVLPVGLPREAREPRYWYAFPEKDGVIHGYMTANHPYHLKPGHVPVNRLTKQEYHALVLEFEERRND